MCVLCDSASTENSTSEERNRRKSRESMMQRGAEGEASGAEAGDGVIECRDDSRKRPLTRAHSRGDAIDSAASATLAGHMMWKIAMKMSQRNDSRILQHFSRSILSIGVHKHSDRAHGDDHSHDQDTNAWQNQVKPITSASQSDKSDESSDTAPESDRPSVSSRESIGSSHALPPLPPLDFTPSKGFRSLSRGTSFRMYTKWPIAGVRPGLSVRILRTEATSSMPSVTEYVLQVIDLHTKVFWISKKRFHDLYVLRKKIRDIIKAASSSDCEQLKYLIDLPFPRRRFRSLVSDSDGRQISELESFLRNVAALEPTTKVRLEILRDFQHCMCSSEFISSLEKVDTTGEPVEPKWLSYDLFTKLNSVATVEGHTCYKFLEAFRNRCSVIQAAVCPECCSFADASLAQDALKDLRTVLTNVEKYIVDHMNPRYADQFSLLEQSVDVSTVVDDCVFHAVEDTILVPLDMEISFLVERTINRVQEERLMENIEKMRGRSQTEFGIPDHLQSEDDWGKSCHHLSMIDERQLPCDKIQELLRSALEIFRSCGEKNLDWRENSALTADDYLPIHIFVVVHSGLKRPLVTKEYLGAMIHPSKMMGEIGYFLTMFEVALQYIADM